MGPASLSAPPIETRLPNSPSRRTLPGAFFAFLACLRLPRVFFVFVLGSLRFRAQLRLLFDSESSFGKSFLDFFLRYISRSSPPSHDFRHFSSICSGLPRFFARFGLLKSFSLLFPHIFLRFFLFPRFSIQFRPS